MLLYTPDSSGPVGRTYHVDGLVPKLFVFKLSWYHLGYVPRPWGLGLGLGLTEANIVLPASTLLHIRIYGKHTPF